MNVHWPPVDDGTTTYRPTADRAALANRKHGGNNPMARNLTLDFTFDAIDLRIRCTAQPCGSLCDYIEHRLNICRRASDDAQNLARRRLLFQRFSEFLKQPHVFDRNHSLIGEGCNQFYVRFRKRADLPAMNPDRADQLILL